MPKLEVFFDYTCPYCYRGHIDFMEVLPAFPAADIVWRPVEAHPRLEEPHHKPYVDLAVQGAFFVRAKGGDELAYHERVYRANFVEKQAIDEIGVLAKYAGELGYDALEFENALRSGTYVKEQLAANDHAYEECKVWAVPTFVCGDKRLDAMEGVGVTKEEIEALLGVCFG
jgi:predicted DsbA family dithiol-disulfide isomerase